MRVTPTDIQTGRARELRRNSTDAERRVWRALRDRQFAEHKFRRQHPLGRYIVDFVCLDRLLVIEVDGGHHAEQQDYDDVRDAWLRSEGFRVLRFSNREVLTALESVKEAVWMALGDTPHPSPLPQGERGSDLSSGETGGGEGPYPTSLR